MNNNDINENLSNTLSETPSITELKITGSKTKNPKLSFEDSTKKQATTIEYNA